MLVDNHFYSRGYQIVKARDGNHRSPDSLSQGSGYSTVGASKGLELSKIDMLESSSFMDFNAGSELQLQSLYFYPRFCEVRNNSFALLGQATTHESNFSDSRPNYFVHNLIIKLKDFKSLILMREPDVFLSYPFKDTYVDADDGQVKVNELAYQNCITPKVDIVSEYRKHGIMNSELSMPINEKLAKAIIVGLLKKKCCVVCVSEAQDGVDKEARRILYHLYKWLPVKLLLTMGFITCLNSSQSHKTCNLVFCCENELETIKRSGVGTISPAEMIFVDSSQVISGFGEERMAGFGDEVMAYINWMAKCMAGLQKPQDESIIKEMDSFELDTIQQRSIHLVFSSKTYELLNAIKTLETQDETDLKAFAVFAEAWKMFNDNKLKDAYWINIAKNDIINERVERIVVSGKVDEKVIELDSENPNALDLVMPYFSRTFKMHVRGSSRSTIETIGTFRDHIYSLRILNSSYKRLYEMALNANDEDLLKIINVAKSDKSKVSHSPDDYVYRYKIAALALFRSPFNQEQENLNAAKELAEAIFISADFHRVNCIPTINSLSEFVQVLYVYQMSGGKNIVNMCESIVSDMALKRSEREIITFRRLLDVNRGAELNTTNKSIILAILKYAFILCAQNEYNFDYSIDPFIKTIPRTAEYASVWDTVVEYASSMFIKSVADKNNSFAKLTYLYGSIFTTSLRRRGTDRGRSLKTKQGDSFITPYGIKFIEKITPAFTVLLILNGYHQISTIAVSVYKEIVKGCQRGYFSTSAKVFKDTMMRNEIVDIGKDSLFSDKQEILHLSSDDIKAFRSLQNREKASIIANAIELAGLKDYEDHKAFFEYLDVKPLPSYSKCNGSDYDVALDNLHKAFEDEEERPALIEKCLNDLGRKFDISRIGVFSNDANTSGVSLFNVISEKRHDTDLFKAFFDFVRKSITEKQSEIDLSGDSAQKCYEKLFNIIANIAIYDLGQYIEISDITNYNIEAIHPMIFSKNSIIALVKYLDQTQAIIRSICGDQGCTRFLYLTENVREYLENALIEKAQDTDVFQTMNDLLSYNLESVLCFFPNFVRFVADKIKESNEDDYRNSQGNLITKIRQINESVYCTDDEINETLNQLLTRNMPKKKKKKTIPIIACLLVLLIGCGVAYYVIRERIGDDFLSDKTIMLYDKIDETDQNYKDLVLNGSDEVYLISQQTVRISDNDQITVSASELEQRKTISANPDYCYGKQKNRAVIEVIRCYPIKVTLNEKGASEPRPYKEVYNFDTKRYSVSVKDGQYCLPEDKISALFEKYKDMPDFKVYIRICKNQKALASIEESNYPNINEMWEEVESGDKITLTEDWEIDETINIDKNLTINADNHVIKRAKSFNGVMINVQSDKELEILNATLDGNQQTQVEAMEHKFETPDNTDDTGNTPSGEASDNDESATLPRLELMPFDSCLFKSTQSIAFKFKLSANNDANVKGVRFVLHCESNSDMSLLDRFKSEDSQLNIKNNDENSILIEYSLSSDRSDPAKEAIFSVSFDPTAFDNSELQFNITDAFIINGDDSQTAIESKSDSFVTVIINDDWFDSQLLQLAFYDNSGNSINLMPKGEQNSINAFQPDVREYELYVDYDISELQIHCQKIDTTQKTINCNFNGNFDTENEFTIFVGLSENFLYTIDVKRTPMTDSTNQTSEHAPVIDNQGRLTLTHVIITNNCNDQDGAGAIFNRGKLSLDGCQIKNNYGGKVGAIHNSAKSETSFKNSRTTIQNNYGGRYGGVFNDRSCKITMESGTIQIKDNYTDSNRLSNFYMQDTVSISVHQVFLGDNENHIGLTADGKVHKIADVIKSNDETQHNDELIVPFYPEDDTIESIFLTEDSSIISIKYKGEDNLPSSTTQEGDAKDKTSATSSTKTTTSTSVKTTSTATTVSTTTSTAGSTTTSTTTAKQTEPTSHD